MTATLVPPTSRPRALTDGPLRLQLRGGPLVGGHDRQDLLHPLARLEHLGQPRPLLAERGDHRLVLAVNHLGRQSQRGDVLGHVLDLRRRRIRFHDHDHGSPPSLWAGREFEPGSALEPGSDARHAADKIDRSSSQFDALPFVTLTA